MKIRYRYKGVFEPPHKHSPEAAGIDLFNNGDTITIQPGQSKKIPTGFYVELPEGYVGFVIARSSLGFKFDCTLTNSVGVIDSDYRGEVGLKITNLSEDSPKTIASGERVAQFIVLPIPATEYELTDEQLSETDRGENGFGSTGEK